MRWQLGKDSTRCFSALYPFLFRNGHEVTTATLLLFISTGIVGTREHVGVESLELARRAFVFVVFLRLQIGQHNTTLAWLVWGL